MKHRFFALVFRLVMILTLLALSYRMNIVYAQTFAGSVPCKLSLLSSSNLKDETGAKVGMFKGRVHCKNNSMLDLPMTAADFDFGVPTVNFVPSTDASNMMNRAIANEFGQRVGDDLTSGQLFFNGLVAAGKIGLSATTGGIANSIIDGVRKYVIPRFNVGKVQVDFTNECDNIGQSGDVVLKVGRDMVCQVWVQKPPKGTALLPSVIDFSLDVISNGPAPAPPPIPPVQLRPPAGLKKRGAIEPGPSNQAIAKILENPAADPELAAATRAWLEDLVSVLAQAPDVNARREAFSQKLLDERRRLEARPVDPPGMLKGSFSPEDAYGVSIEARNVAWGGWSNPAANQSRKVR